MKPERILRLALSICLFLSSLQICSINSAVAAKQTGQSGAFQKHVLRVPAGWTVHKGQNGLIVFHPQGWKIHPRGRGAFVVYRLSSGGGADALALVQPLESIKGRAAGVVEHIGQVFPDLFPDVAVSNLRHASKNPEVALSDLRYRAGKRAFQGSAMCFRQQQRGVVYVIAAAQSSWSRDEAVLKKILSSFFYAGRDTAGTHLKPAAGLPKMTAWQDPVENAFSCPVPRGWKVEGGTQRLTAIDVRHQLVATSPDGGVLIRIGDAGIPQMVLNSEMMLSYGFQEGSWYSPDGLNQMLVMRYFPGSYFLSEFYLPNQFERVTVTSHKDLPQISQQAFHYFSQAGLQVRVDTGELHFEVPADGGPRKGYGFAQTIFMPLPGMPNAGHWWVNSMLGYVAASGREALAEAVLNRMVSGYQMNPQWVAMQIRTTGKAAKITSETNREIESIISRTFAKRAASEDRMADQRSRLIRDQVLVEDPQTGENFELPAGSNYYWRQEGSEIFLGTESPDMPNYWLREMKVLD